MRIGTNKKITMFIAVLIILLSELTPALAGHIDFNYDNTGRLIQADFGQNRDITYLYDNNGNLLRRTAASVTIHDGDVDHSGTTDLTDTALILKILAGSTPSGIYKNSDIDNNNTIDMGDAVFSMQRMTGKR